MSSDEPIWCDECGRPHPWQSKRSPTLRRRIARTLAAPFYFIAGRCYRVTGWLIEVADRPEREKYERSRAR